jgi:hypothetical protein
MVELQMKECGMVGEEILDESRDTETSKKSGRGSHK